MKLEVHYTRKSFGPFKWSARTVVTQRDQAGSFMPGHKIVIESEPSSTKWGATWSLKRRVRDHIRSNQTIQHFSEVIQFEV